MTSFTYSMIMKIIGQMSFVPNAENLECAGLAIAYQPLNDTSYFTAYTADGFNNRDQSELAKVFKELDSRGCLVLLSNSDTSFTRALYSDFSIKEVDAQRAINCKGSKRAGHKELLISNYS